MNLIYSLIIVFLGGLCFSFIFWRRLREDYIGSQIFTSIFIVLTLTSLAYFFSFSFFRNYYFWFSFSGFFIGVILSSYRFKLRFYEIFESAIIAVFPFLSGIFLLDVVKSSSIYSLGAFAVTFSFQFLYLYINNRYKNYGWYKSGRIGFAGLTTLGLYFMMRGVVAIPFPFVLSFSGGYETIISGVVSFMLFLAVFDLSRK